MHRRDWNLLVLAAAGVRGLTPVQLQKSLFLLGQEFPNELAGDYYAFVPYHYGPFTSDVYTDAEALEADGLIQIIRSPSSSWRIYTITPAGTEAAAAIEKRAEPRMNSYIKKMVAWMKSISFQDLIKTIYQHFPTYRVNSVFQG